VIVRGAGPNDRTGPPGASIKAKSTFAASTPLVQLGDNASNSVYCRLEDIGIDGDHYADIGVYSNSINEESGMIRVYSNSINEESGMIRCTVVDCDTYCIHMDNSTTGLLRNFLLRDLYVLNDTVGTAIGVYIHGGSSPQRGIDGLTVGSAVQAFDVGLQLDGCQGAVFERMHFEYADDGIKIGPNVGCHAMTFIGVTGHSSVTDLVHIDNATSSSTLTFIGQFANSATNNINDVVNGVTLTSNYVNHYTTGNIFTVPWNNYYSSSTVTGWSSLSTTTLYYKRVGDLVFVNFNLVGTSDTTTVSFTLPDSAATGSIIKKGGIRIQDNGTWQTTPGYLSFSGSTATIYKNLNSGAFTASGTKAVQGQFWYET
jgi:hypothetical protein